MRGVVLDRLPLDQGDLNWSALETAFDELTCHDATQPGEIAGRLQGAVVAFTNKVVLDAQTLAHAQQLELICVLATGTDNVDQNAARQLGMAVVNCRAYATAAVSQHVFALLTALVTHWHDYHAGVAAGRWQQAGSFCFLDHPIRELAGRTLGIVGYGELGRAVAAIATVFGMDVLVSQRPDGSDDRADRVAFADLLARADVLSLHCPLTPATHNLIDADALSRMQTHALLINTARGGLVDSQALAIALQRGEIAGAGLDVLDAEPPAADHPLLAQDIPNLIVTPHCAWGSHAARQRVLDQTAENIAAFRQGRSLRRIV